MLEFRAYDSSEVQNILKSIYSDCHFTFSDGGRARFRISEIGPISLFNVICSSPFTFLSEDESKTLVIHHCLEGNVDYRRNDTSLQLNRGDVAPISSARTSFMKCNSNIAHQTISFDEAILNLNFSKFNNGKYHEPIVFDFTKLSNASKTMISNVIHSIDILLDDIDPLNMDFSRYGEFFSYFLLREMDGNHNRIGGNDHTVADSKYKEAEKYILDNAETGVSLVDLVQVAGCDVNDLNKKFLQRVGVGVNGAIICARRAANSLSRNLNDLSLEEVVAGYRHEGCVNPFEHLTEPGRNGTGGRTRIDRLSPHNLQKALHHINANLAGKISISRLSSLLDMSRQTFTEAFKKSTGVTPAAYILEERVKWAQWMIRNTNENLASIAIETGFSSQSHMTTSIRRFTNATPSEFRKRQYYNR